VQLKWKIVLIAALFGLLPTPAAGQTAGVRESTFVALASGHDLSAPMETVLIAGLDRDPDSHDRDRRTDDHADALILLSSRPGSGVVQALHIPRDTRVWTPCGQEKVNGALRHGGARALLHVVSVLTGMPVANLITVDFSRFRRVMQAVGPFSFYVDRTVVSPERDAAVLPGQRRLSPREALAVVRFRHEALGDIGRVHRQERFMRRAIFRAAQMPYPLFARLLRVADPTVSPAVIRTAYRLIHPLRSYTAHSVPGSFSTGPGVSYWLADHAGLCAVVRIMRGERSASAALYAWSRARAGLDVDDGRDRSL